ncbi:TIR domain-containing protein [Specibacter sp. RAF43]|uniref:TIR domain-containing protein n=1 Tax=Specibacter sp. RAF43 TaxID=3233057 RepID=UPI003F94925A
MKVFIGSSSEGKRVADRLAMRLDDQGFVESKVWTQSVFEPGAHVLESLIQQASTTDFAVLVLGPDDRVDSRDVQSQAPRDNVVFELGLFIGALGKDRTYMVQPNGISLKLPSDLAGITQVRYDGQRRDNDLSSALGPAAIKIHDQIMKLGARKGGSQLDKSSPSLVKRAPSIARNLEVLEANLAPQGWKFRWNVARTTLRITSPRGHRRSLKVLESSEMPLQFDRFIRDLRGLGARVDSSLRSRPQ